MAVPGAGRALAYQRLLGGEMKKFLALIFVMPFCLLLGLLAIVVFSALNYVILSWGYGLCFNLFHWLLFIFVLIPVSLIVSFLVAAIPGCFCENIWNWFADMSWKKVKEEDNKYTKPSEEEIKFFNSIEKKYHNYE